MPLIYRSMQADSGLPAIGNLASALGVRLPPSKDADLPVDADGAVHPNTGGMSVAPSWRCLPPWRISKRLRGKVEGASGSANVFCWRMGAGEFAAERVAPGLQLNPDSDTHGTVEPDRPMPLSEYQGALAATRDQWVIDEE
jgi:hypothetical protein